MSLKINGVEPTSILVNENGTITELKKLYVFKNKEKKLCWRKPYRLTIFKGSHSNVLVETKATVYSKGTQIKNGSAIYHDSYLDIMITGQQGYIISWKINGITQSATKVTVPITGDVNISVTETAATTTLKSPVISGSYSYDSYMGSYYLSCKISNNNFFDVTASIIVYSDGDRLDGSCVLNVPVKSTQTYDHGEMYSNGAKVIVTFSRAGYGDSVASTTFGNFTGSSSTTDETTSIIT